MFPIMQNIQVDIKLLFILCAYLIIHIVLTIIYSILILYLVLYIIIYDDITIISSELKIWHRWSVQFKIDHGYLLKIMFELHVFTTAYIGTLR